MTVSHFLKICFTHLSLPMILSIGISIFKNNFEVQYFLVLFSLLNSVVQYFQIFTLVHVWCTCTGSPVLEPTHAQGATRVQEDGLKENRNQTNVAVSFSITYVCTVALHSYPDFTHGVAPLSSLCHPSSKTTLHLTKPRFTSHPPSISRITRI